MRSVDELEPHGLAQQGATFNSESVAVGHHNGRDNAKDGNTVLQDQVSEDSYEIGREGVDQLTPHNLGLVALVEGVEVDSELPEEHKS